MISTTSHTTCKRPPAIEPVPIMPPKNRGIVHGTTKRKIGTNPPEITNQPITVLTNGAKIYGINKIGLSTIGIPKASGS